MCNSAPARMDLFWCARWAQSQSMKVLGAILAAVLSGAGLGNLHAQGTFQNLDFEQADLAGFGVGSVSVSNALPHWAAYFNGYPISHVVFDDVALGDAAVSIHDSSSLSWQPIQGNYSVFLQGAGFGVLRSSALGQYGQIPVGAASVRFWADPRSNLEVTFGGQLIPIFRVASTPSYDIFGGSVNGFAGQTAELRFTGPANSGGYFDNVFFSNQPIPEPGTLYLSSLGVVCLGWRLRSRHSCG